MATIALSPIPTAGNVATPNYATITDGRVAYNKAYIFLQAHAMRRADARILADMKAAGMNGGELDTFGRCLKRAWQDAKSYAGDMAFIGQFNAPKKTERERLETESLAIHMRTRIGVDGQRRLGEITRHLSRLAA